MNYRRVEEKDNIWEKCEASYCEGSYFFVDRHSWDWVGERVWVQLESIDHLPWVKIGPLYEGRVRSPKGAGWKWSEKVTVELEWSFLNPLRDGQCVEVYPQELWIERRVPRCTPEHSKDDPWFSPAG